MGILNLKRKLCLFFILFVILIVDVEAICSSSEVKILKEKAEKVEFLKEVRIVNYGEDISIHNKMAQYDITAYNTDNDLKIYIGYTDEEETKFFEYNDSRSSTLKNFYAGKLKIRIVGNTETCGEKILTVEYLDLLYYNPFYGTDRCLEYLDFELCKSEFASEYVDDVVFSNKLDEYLKDKKVDEQKNDVEKEKNGEKKVFNPLILIALIILFGGVLGFIVYKIVKYERIKSAL